MLGMTEALKLLVRITVALERIARALEALRPAPPQVEYEQEVPADDDDPEWSF